MPVLRRPARPGRAHLSARQRIPALISAEDLAAGDLHVVGQISGASNTTVLARLGDPDEGPYAVYKPISGERPLWDFPDGSLAARERAAYLVSEAGGWHVVPPTVLRDGPLGVGMAQAWVGEPGAAESVVHVLRPGSDARGLLPVLRAEDERGRPLLIAHEDRPDVRSLAVLDVLLNNADRKGAHAFRHDGRMYAVDHGVTFHVEHKLRTVLWGWEGEPLTDGDAERVDALRIALDRTLADELAGLLTAREIEALHARVSGLLRRPRLPRAGGGWPAIPWPPL
ncbi:MAG: SCO1664 family protein [Dermatophilaceae bacterium]